MDINKLDKLREIGYGIRICCGLCQHSEFPHPGSDFGTCKAHKYDHLKHTDATRQLSINRYGLCQKFVRADDSNLGTWEEFVHV